MYQVIACLQLDDAESRSTGGVALYVWDDIKYDIILTRKLVSNCWYIAIEVKEKLHKGVIMVVYHLPSASHDDFITFMEDIVEELIIEKYIVLGDLNIDFMIEDSFYTKKLQSIMLS
ncbi:hypothetical protein ALC60_13471 [Trachymyrmex zeteki]|uniref:Endonuclease/exonuclease/phosphatase domain-containing protein n=1 Tax=Mycetomoellerius zeteki TaxID=64791 RepID=A0A151WI31_9HYME|nr:hypothetical protein ALC60_13471 [Trachymyrmex zeteki]